MDDLTMSMALLPFHITEDNDDAVHTKDKVIDGPSTSVGPGSENSKPAAEVDAVSDIIAPGTDSDDKTSATRAPQPGEDQFSFLNLPPEVRNMIYALLLPRDTPYVLGRDRRRNGYHFLAGRKRRARYEVSYSLPSILFANKQASVECTTWLYGSNGFSFSSVHGASKFLRAIGPNNVARIREFVVTDRLSPSAAPRMSRALVPAAENGLQKLDLSLVTVISPRRRAVRNRAVRASPKDVASAFSALFAALYQKHKSVAKVFGVVTFDQTPADWFWEQPLVQRYSSLWSTNQWDQWEQSWRTEKAKFLSKLEAVVREDLEG